MKNISLNITQETLLYAFKYAIGRQTYIVSEVVNIIINNWNNLNIRLQKRIKKIIKEHINNKNIGMNIDKKEWEKILNLKYKDNKNNDTIIANNLILMAAIRYCLYNKNFISRNLVNDFKQLLNINPEEIEFYNKELNDNFIINNNLRNKLKEIIINLKKED